MSSPSAQWKHEQRALLRAAFAPAFVKYTELAYASGETDDMRKYVEFLAKQLALEEPGLKNDPNAGLTMVQINIGNMHRTAGPMNGVIPREAREQPVDVIDATPSEVIVQYAPKAALQAIASLEPPEELHADFDRLMDSLQLEPA